MTHAPLPFAAAKIALFSLCTTTALAQSTTYNPELNSHFSTTQIIKVASQQSGFSNLRDTVPNQEMLQGLLASGTFSALVFNMNRAVSVEIKDGYWAETIPLGSAPEGAQFRITRTSSWDTKVTIAGERDAIAIAKGMTYDFAFSSGRWQVIDVRQAQFAAPPQPVQQPPAAQTGQGMNVPQSEIFQRKQWFAVKLDNSWYAATASKRYAKQNFYVRFDPANSCTGYVGYDYPANGNAPQTGPFQQNMRLNTGKKTWTVDAGGASVRFDAPSDSVLIEFSANMDFIATLAKKNTVKLGFGAGSDYYDDLSLSGSWASIVWALDRCKSDSIRTPAQTPFSNPPSGPAQNSPTGFCSSCEPPRDTTRSQLESVARFEGEGADGYMSNFTFINNFGEWPYQCNGPECYLDMDEIGQMPVLAPQPQQPDGYCWSRTYSYDHLRSHPEQVVASIWLEFDGNPNGGGDVSAKMRVRSSENTQLQKFGNANQFFTQGLVCIGEPGTRVCTADSDGGSMQLNPVDGTTMDLQTTYLSVWGGRDNSFDLAEVPGQHTTYRLTRQPATVCREWR